MSEQRMTREEAEKIADKMYNNLASPIREFFIHEAEYGYWLPKQYETNPSKWLLILSDINDGLREYRESHEEKKGIIKIIKHLWEKFQQVSWWH